MSKPLELVKTRVRADSVRFEGKRYVSAILSKRVPFTRGRTLDTYVRDADASQSAEIRAA